MDTFRYTVSEDGKTIDVEHAGSAPMGKETDYEAKAKALIESTLNMPKDSFEVKRVDDLATGVITSEETPKKR